MPGVHSLQHVKGFCTANLTDDYSVGAHPERIAYQIALNDLTVARRGGRSRFQADEPANALSSSTIS